MNDVATCDVDSIVRAMIEAWRNEAARGMNEAVMRGRRVRLEILNRQCVSYEKTVRFAHSLLPMSRLPESYPVSPQLIAGEYPGAARYTTAAPTNEKLASLLDAGVTAFIDLTEAGELPSYADALDTLARERNVQVTHERHPIRDMSTNTPDAMRDTLDSIDAHHAAGRTVYVHCWGGIGRTGTTVACWLVRHGMSPDNALAAVDEGFSTMPKRALMPGHTSPERPEQILVVKAWKAGD